MSTLAPLPRAERVAALDALRGAALLGVLVVNLETDFRISLFDWLGAFDAHGTTADHVFDYAIAVLLEGKAFGLFAILFGGVGVALLALHALHLPPVEFPGAFVAHGEEARRVYGEGSFMEIARYRIDELRWIVPLHVSVLPRTIGLALVGAAAWRAGVPRDPVAWARVLRPLACVAAPLGVGAHAVLAYAATRGTELGALGGALDTFGTVAAALGYGSALLLGFSTPLGAALLGRLAPLGRTALTAYLAQSLILTSLFYGWGLGWFGHISAFQGLVVALGIYATQVAVAAAWTARFEHGPVEALWRAATYGRWRAAGPSDPVVVSARTPGLRRPRQR